MELTLIRHGQSANNAQGDEARHHDPELTPLGWTQARRLGQYLAEKENVEEIVRMRSDDPRRLERSPFAFDTIYVSAMHRALQTAQPIAEALKAEVRIWPELHESGGIYMHTPEGVICHGGLTRAEITSSFPAYMLHDAITDEGWYNKALGEEDMYGCYARAMRVAKTLRQMAADAETKDRRIAIVSHGNFIVALINALTDNLPSEGLYFWHYNTAMTRIDFAANGWMIVRYVNRCDHLPPQWVT
jgi:2,3-bisphosphoglycerate-dependent phosphoglycerate mutase